VRSSAVCRRSRFEWVNSRPGPSVLRWSRGTRTDALTAAVGELVVTAPMPSMPVGFWGDVLGLRYRESYFSMFPGVWRHGDWIEITDAGGAIIYGRSDSTINRGGVRIGTSEIYRAVLAEDAIVDALVVDLSHTATGWIVLFVVLRPGIELSDQLVGQLRRQIREYCSPRHIPDEIISIPEVPRTLSGKVLEVPVKRILEGAAPATAASKESLANPAALEPFVRMAERWSTSVL
jgi:acetoacetyl-CoA synthetase